MKLDLDGYRKKINDISTNVAIYKDHLGKFKTKLKERFGLDFKRADNRLKEIEKETRQLAEKEKKLNRQAEKMLERIEDE